MKNAIVLDSAAITALLASKRERGGHERNIRQFIASGEMYRDLSEVYPGKTAAQLAALKNTLTMKAKALDLSNVRFLKAEDTVIIVNTDNVVTEESE